ncbi:hypothetical protein AB205_0050950 [Aquarana catesbeiana]|uniref:Uncharacterized protein n=1 Tax=Aquarana catesbeiana TaxID=8400 RepID=A0A2G9P188_AQUCT|nr:hypothetical protein AB205_0050950 [Aquarana catesbeiana]
MRFLEDQTEVRSSFFTLPSPPAEASEDQPGPSIQEEVEEPSLRQESLSQDEGLECGSQEVAGGSGSQEVDGPSGLIQSQVPPLHLPPKRPRKGRNVDEAALALTRDAHATLRDPPSIQEGYACIVAVKMQEMEEGQCLICENIILHALNKGLSGQLTENTHLSEFVNPPPPPPPPATTRRTKPQHVKKHASKTRE